MNIFFQQGLCYDESGPARGAKVRKGIKGEALISAGARHGAKVRGREAPARARRARRQQGPPEERAQGSGRIKRARRAQKKTKPPSHRSNDPRPRRWVEDGLRHQLHHAAAPLIVVAGQLVVARAERVRAAQGVPEPTSVEAHIYSFRRLNEVSIPERDRAGGGKRGLTFPHPQRVALIGSAEVVVRVRKHPCAFWRWPVCGRRRRVGTAARGSGGGGRAG